MSLSLLKLASIGRIAAVAVVKSGEMALVACANPEQHPVAAAVAESYPIEHDLEAVAVLPDPGLLESA